MSKQRPPQESGSQLIVPKVLDQPGRILLIDDDASVISLFSTLLRESDHEVFEALDGSTGLRLARENEVDLVILDVDMPDMTGFEVCQRLRAYPKLKYVPVMMVTALQDVESQLRGLASGATDFLSKPVNLKILRARVASLLRYRHAVSALCQAHDELEVRVAERTEELVQAVGALKSEISGRERVEQALRVSEERYALAARGANDGLWDWNLQEDRIYYSPRWKEMAGCGEEEVDANPDEWFRRVHPDDRDKLKEKISVHLKGTTSHLEIEFQFRHKDGSYRWMLCRGMAVRDGRGQASRIAGSFTDITDQKRQQLQLLHNAFHDAVTSLPNRTLFMDRLSQAILRTKSRPDALFAILYLGLERFNLINESYGHRVGDQLLEKVARRLENAIPASDTVARVGGVDFAILLEEVSDVAAARKEASRLKAELAKPFELEVGEVFVSIRVGIAIRPKKHRLAEDLLRDANTAMQQAKSQDKSDQEVYLSGMHAAVVTELQLETELRRAVTREEFLLNYQPILALNPLRPIGFEALMRWLNPRQGMVSPGEFIPVAEATGLIAPMTWWVLNTACWQIKLWQKLVHVDPPLTVSVNLSSQVITHPELIPQLERVLKATGISPSSLKLEITESVVLDRSEKVSAVLDELRERKLELHMDDFGTGYSSLSYLNRLPIEVLKIDRSFVGVMGEDGENSEIVRNILSLAHDLNIEVVAEGVETKEQLATLQSMKCEYAQGYYFAKPMTVEKATKWIEEYGVTARA